MRTLFIVLLTAILITGCSDSSRVRGDQADLDNVALCFYGAVAVLQAEPESPDDLAVFIQHAKSVIAPSDGSSTDADFGALRWNASGTSLMTSSGQPIRCRVVGQAHANYGPEGSAWFTDYEFYVPGADYRSRTTIELAMRR